MAIFFRSGGGSSGGVTQTPGSSGHPSLLAAANIQTLAGSSTMTANQARGVRARIGKAGTLTNMYVCVASASGNFDVGVYDAGAPRTKLWSSGSIAVPAGPGWVSVGTPNITVTQGQEVDLVAQIDNATATFYRYTVTNTAVTVLPLPSMLDGTGLAYVMWAFNVGSFGLPATIDDTAFLVTGSIPAMIGRIA